MKTTFIHLLLITFYYLFFAAVEQNLYILEWNKEYQFILFSLFVLSLPTYFFSLINKIL